jgi:hypothetical protein
VYPTAEVEDGGGEGVAAEKHLELATHEIKRARHKHAHSQLRAGLCLLTASRGSREQTRLRT